MEAPTPCLYVFVLIFYASGHLLGYKDEVNQNTSLPNTPSTPAPTISSTLPTNASISAANFTDSIDIGFMTGTSVVSYTTLITETAIPNKLNQFGRTHTKIGITLKTQAAVEGSDRISDRLDASSESSSRDRSSEVKASSGLLTTPSLASPLHARPGSASSPRPSRTLRRLIFSRDRRLTSGNDAKSNPFKSSAVGQHSSASSGERSASLTASLLTSSASPETNTTASPHQFPRHPSLSSADIPDPQPGLYNQETPAPEYNVTSVPAVRGPPVTLHIGGLFELSGKHGPNGCSELDAALLAIAHINQKDAIPGYKLKLLYNDSKCDPGFGTDAFFDFIYRKSNESSLVMVMGSACTEVTKTIAEIVPYWNLILISYAATSPALSEREKYRTFFRLALGDSALNPARRMLIKHFMWDKVAALYEDHESLSLAFNGINKDFSAHDIAIKSSTSFKDAKLEVPGKLKDLMDLDVRIIVGGFTEAAARQVFCQAYKLDMYGPRYVWILVGWLKRSWWTDALDSPCTPQEIETAVEGAFAIFSLNGLLDGNKSVADLTSSEFVESYIKANGSRPMSIFAASTYDTVWTMALTLRQATENWAKNGTAPLLHQLSYEDMADVKETFISTMEDLEFPGVSGPVSFKGSDREGISAVFQIQGGNFTQVAIHHPTTGSLDFECDSCHKIIWKDGRVPKDEQVVVVRPKTIEMSVFYACTGLCVLGVVLAVCFLTYNLYHRRLKFIKLSSPKLNNVAVIGCILVYVAVVMLGLDDRTLDEDAFPIICTTRAFLLAAGFSLAFGAMFAKTFRVHQIFTRAHHGLVKSKLIQDTHLLVIIGVLLAVDSSLVLVWVLVDPMSRHVSNTTKEVSADDEDLIFQEQLTTCHSGHLQKWLGAFYAYKGLLLVFGVYMAWETRHVKIPALNDSQYIGLNVYNVVIMSVSVVVISNILSNQPTLAYAMEASFMFLSTTVTLCLLFVPKIYAIVTSGGNPIIACTGILVDNSNTRRFVFDDRKEIYYRAEVQNRVYKRELVELDQKIERLEMLLELPIQNHTRLTDELLYLLPESKVDGTPRCHRRYKKELERCHSISDGGEGVIYDATENDDILMEMGFTTDFRPTPPAKKRHHSGDLSRVGTKTLQKLTRSLSIGGGGRARRKRKCQDPSKALTPLSASEIDVMKCGDSGDGPGIGKLRTGKQKPGRYSEDLSYLYGDTLLNIPMDRGHSSSSVPMLDKVTQTNCGASLQELEGARVDVGSGLPSAKRDEVAGYANDVCYELLPDARDRERGKERSGPEEYSHGGRKPVFHLHPINSKQGKLFAVQRLHVELVEEDSNSTSNNEDAESLAGSANGSGDVNNIPSDVSGDSYAHQRKSTTRPLHRSAAVCNSEPVTWYERNQRLSSSSPSHNRSSPHTYLQPYGEFDCMQERSRSISSPDPPKATRSEQTVAPSPETSTGLLPTTTSCPLHYSNPSCLCKEFVHFIQAETRAQPPPGDYLRYNLLTTSPRRSPDSLRVAQSKLKEDNPNKSNGTELYKLSGLLSSTKSLCSNVSLASSQSPEHGCLLIHKSGCPLAENTLQTGQNQSLEWEPHFSSLLESNSVDSQEIGTDAAQVMSSTLHTPIRMSGVEGQRSVLLESERRQRIQKLQTDLKKIQMELKDLTDIDCDTSEV